MTIKKEGGECDMSKLEYFLNPTEKQETKEITVSERFKDEKGNLATIKIRSITQSENDALIKKCTVREKNRQGVVTEVFDKTRYSALLMLACIVEPNFKSPEFAERMGVVDPCDAIRALFLPGEYAKISEALLDLMGLDDNVGVQAKNS